MSGVYINDDAWSLFANRTREPWCVPPETMDEAGLKRQIDYYAVSGVKGILFNPNAMRAFFDSRTFDPLWKGMEEGPDGKARFRGKEIRPDKICGEDMQTVCRSVKMLFENVRDPYRFRYNYCRKKGVEMWISMRMNDIHYADDDSRISHSDFWRAHPELRRAEYKKDHTFWPSRCFDYGHEAVWNYHMALAKEYFERFEMDGFEVDWMRSPYLFKPGFAESNRELLTEFMREIRRQTRQAAERWGHPVRINVRVPSRPEEALYLGMDIWTWMREKLFDMIAPTPSFCSSESTMPVGLWRQIIPADIILAPVLEENVGGPFGQVRMVSRAEIDYGFAASYLYQGADCIYLFNHMYRTGQEDQVKQQNIFRFAGARETVECQERRHVATVHESLVEGLTSVTAFDKPMPPGMCRSVRLNVGGGTTGRKAYVLIGLSESRDAQEEPAVEIRLNTEKGIPVSEYPLPILPQAKIRTLVSAIPPSALHDGENLIDIINKSAQNLTLEWVEIHLPTEADSPAHLATR